MALRNRGSSSQTTKKSPLLRASLREEKHKTEKSTKPTKPRLWVRVLLIVVLILMFVYVLVPVVIRASSWVQQALIYVHHIKTPLFGNISNPTEFGLQNAREFELYHKGDGCEIEVWHVLPKTYNYSESHDYTAALSDGAPIILYLHGNTGTRATYHRVELYKFLAEQRGYHVITFDYRGFGNSLCFPSESGMMEDGYLVWRWIQQHATNSPVFIWGHSLGSAAATYLTKELSHHQDAPSGLILDAPFTNIIEAAMSHPFSLPFWPGIDLFRYLVLESFEERFQSDTRMEHITCPMLILHGQDDFIVPFALGRSLYDKAAQSRRMNPKLGEVQFVDCGSTSHKNNYAYPHINIVLDSFIGVH